MQDPYIRRFRLLPTDRHPYGVVDGDTFYAHIDLGFRSYTEQIIRILGVNCPEMTGLTHDAGMAAADYTENWFFQHKHIPTGMYIAWPFTLRSEKGDSFGRWLADIWCSEGHNLSQDLLDSGNALIFSPTKSSQKH